MTDIPISDAVRVREEELEFSFVRSSGPGGQHVNKTATAVQLRFDITNSSLPPDVKQRLRRLAGSRCSAEGVVVLDARRYRSQERNRQDVRERLSGLLERAAQQPRRRRPTKPTRAAKERRLLEKRRRSERKKQRGGMAPE